MIMFRPDRRSFSTCSPTYPVSFPNLELLPPSTSILQSLFYLFLFSAHLECKHALVRTKSFYHPPELPDQAYQKYTENLQYVNNVPGSIPPLLNLIGSVLAGRLFLQCGGENVELDKLCICWNLYWGTFSHVQKNLGINFSLFNNPFKKMSATKHNQY